MREPLEIYDPADKGIQMEPGQAMVGLPGKIGEDRGPAHLCNIYSMEEELYDVVLELDSAYQKVIPELVEFEEKLCDDAEIIILSHGVVSRAADDAVRQLRDQGIRAGYFRPITLRPFPAQALREVLQKSQAGKILVAESSLGQLMRLVRQEIYGETAEISGLLMPGVGIIDRDIIAMAKSLL